MSINEAGHETMEIRRGAASKAPLGVVDLIYSPDDSGYYFSEADWIKNRGRVSSIYRTEKAARAAWSARKIKWEKWS